MSTADAILTYTGFAIFFLWAAVMVCASQQTGDADRFSIRS
jgi:hypothetical protein